MSKLTGSTEEELGTVVGTETSTTATLSLSQDVHGDQELVVGLGAARSSNNHTTLNVVTADTTEEETRVVTCTRLVAGLLEGFDVGDLGLHSIEGSSNNFNLSVTLQLATLNTARSDSTTTRDGEHFLNGHQERLVEVTLGGGDPRVNVVEKLVDLLGTNLGTAALEGTKRRAENNGGLFTLESVAGQKLTHFQLDKLQHLGVLDSVDLVDEHDDLLDTNLTGQQQVLTGLGPVQQIKKVVSK